MSQNKFKDATKIDNATLARNTMKADPSQNGTPIPFQSGYSEYEANKTTQSLFETVIFYLVGVFFSIVIYKILIHYSIDGYLNCFQFEVIIKDSAMKMSM